MHFLSFFCTSLILTVYCQTAPLTHGQSPDSPTYEQQATFAETVAHNRSLLQAPDESSQPIQGVRFSTWKGTLDLPNGSERFDTIFRTMTAPGFNPNDALYKPFLLPKTFSDNAPQRFALTPEHSVLLVRELIVLEEKQVSLSLNYDDAAWLWLNGEEVLSKPGFHGMGGTPAELQLNLKQGTNVLVMRIENARGGAAFDFRYGAVTKAGNNVTQPVTLWRRISADFPQESYILSLEFAKEKALLDWLQNSSTTNIERNILTKNIAATAPYDEALQKRLDALTDTDLSSSDPAWLTLFEDVCELEAKVNILRSIDTEAMRRGVDDLYVQWPDRMRDYDEILVIIDVHERRCNSRADAFLSGRTDALNDIEDDADSFAAFQREILTRNPLLDFDRMLLVRRDFDESATSPSLSTARKVISTSLGMPSLNSHTHDTIRHNGWQNEIAVLSDLRGGGYLETLYKPEQDHILCEVDLEFDAERIMFSSIGANDRWAVFEMDSNSEGLKQLTPDDLPDVDFFDSCYLPDGRIPVTSTAPYQGLPCEYGKKPMASLYLLDPETQEIRRTTYEQDSDWSPVVRPDGRLMYLRWEYTDTPHYFTRILMSCNPDGTSQMEVYGSNSYFPNAYFYPRPIPDTTKLIGIVGGHHGISRSGRLVILDPSQGRREAEGVVQEIPGYGQEVKPLLIDRLINGVWPQFLHPYPLSDKYFLVSAKMGPTDLWGIYLVDVFDNMTLLKEIEGGALLEPIPFRPTERPPVIIDRVVPNATEATVFLADIYLGPGLRGIPHGDVKSLRILSYHYAYVHTGGHNQVGVESSWDVKRILGTVPVEEDGSASFHIPANTPVALQPLDEEGRALQLMRSWLVGMPGENVSCVGCHESQNSVTPSIMTLASRRAPSEITPWYGPARPFGFHNEVQPVLDKYCVGCHDGSEREDGRTIPSLIAAFDEPDYTKATAYMALQDYVRRPGPESDYHITEPMEYHASTSELIQMLKRGHHNVELDREAWDRLYAWIDLNAPYIGRWSPGAWRDSDQLQRRLELAAIYEGACTNPEEEYEQYAAILSSRPKPEFIPPLSVEVAQLEVPTVSNWPFDEETASRMQRAEGDAVTRSILLGYVNPSDEVDTSDPKQQAFPLGYQYADEPFEGAHPIELHLTRIPAGRFVMGPDKNGTLRETAVEKSFWIGTYEISNRQFTFFDPAHDSRYADQSGKDLKARGFPLNRPEQPVCRVSFNEAQAFCEWLSARTNMNVSLPTETQWEWACRAGTDAPFWYDDVNDDFSNFGNLADRSSAQGGKANPFPRVSDINDGLRFSDARGAFSSNPFRLYDMHGNVAEWTLSSADGALPIARGGSWRDRPERATSSFGLSYLSHQKVFNVGFRIVVED
jgi:formylglycine-generating enzyme required for sulfatase activity